MLRSGEREIANEKFYSVKRPIKTLNVNVNNIVIIL